MKCIAAHLLTSPRVVYVAAASALFAGAFMGVEARAADFPPRPAGCFYATTTGDDKTPVSLCTGDPLKIGENVLVASIMRRLGIDQSTVEFNGCPQQKFAVIEQHFDMEPARYVVRYPTEVGEEYLAPITHELAHVLQMQSAGGFEAALKAAQKQNRRVELGADYLTGLVFSQLQSTSPRFNTAQFQHSLSLIGLYDESEVEAHGSPEERTAAFRYGYVNHDRQSELLSAYAYFQANLFAQIHHKKVADIDSHTDTESVRTTASVELDKLTACSDIETLFGRLRRGEIRRTCANENNHLMREIAANSNKNIAGDLCTLANSPAPFLDEFHCFLPPTAGGSDITCFRETNPEAVAQYKKNYKDDYAAPALDYLEKASHCLLSNGDSAASQSSLMPPYLMLIAKFEFGFITNLDSAKPPTSLIHHGYATINPDIGGDVASIEFIQMLTDVPTRKTNNFERRVGDWTVEVDELDEVDAEFNKSLRKAGAPAGFDGRGFDLERRSSRAASRPEKARLLQSLMSAIGTAMEDEGFDEFDIDEDEELSAKFAEMMRNITNRKPYGLDGSLAPRNPKVKIFMKNDRRFCGDYNSDDGKLLVYLLAVEPHDGVEKEFGSIAAYTAALGSCWSSSNRLKTYLDGLLDIANDSVLSELGNQ